MTVLHSVDFFPSGASPVAIEPRLPQAAFPEHHHDFHEIVIVEHGTGIHVFNGQPYTISGGTVCFVRDHDRHLYEHTETCLDHALPFSGCVPVSFRAESAVAAGEGPSTLALAVNQSTLQQVRQLVSQMEQARMAGTHAIATRELLFMAVMLLRRSSLVEGLENNDARLNQLMAWLEDHFAEDVCWETLADDFSLAATACQLKPTGLMPQRYLNRLRLIKARHLLRHTDESVTDIAYRCGFGDSNHFSTLFRREFNWSPRDIRQGKDALLQ
ncbi:MAG: HTH-type transcriptional activator RhaS [Enterobacter hormaechei]